MDVVCHSVRATICASRTMPILGITPGKEELTAGEGILSQRTQKRSTAPWDATATTVLTSVKASGRAQSCARSAGMNFPGLRKSRSLTVSAASSPPLGLGCPGESPLHHTVLARGSVVQGAVLFLIFHVPITVASTISNMLYYGHNTISFREGRVYGKS